MEEDRVQETGGKSALDTFCHQFFNNGGEKNREKSDLKQIFCSLLATQHDLMKFY
jgi:hypothetical protein